MSLYDLVNKEVVHQEVMVTMGEAPVKVAIPPRVMHRLKAVTDTFLLIAGTCPQTPEDTFEMKFPEPD